MPLIGTAGHVDHGKSTLIQRITGRDPDRWDEEKRRGLTIDLGFSWVTLPGGREVSFVDVPGHERFLKNMLAGIEAIDVALFVVAADEGWMPQSEEHLAVLDLLDIDRGLVALTKIDAVDADLVAVARAEVADRLAGSSLAGASIHAVSGETGEGIDAMLQTLEGLLPEDDPGNGRPRLWVDRSFTISGAGTVVTGSLLGGDLALDDMVEVYPQRLEARVRGLQSHEQAHQSIGPGRRVAVNLAGIDHHRVSRGDMVGLPDQWDVTSRFAVTLRRARFVDVLDKRGAYSLHVGSGAHRVEIIALEEGVAVLKTDHPLPLSVGDRFILRETGRQLVVGGGRVLDPGPGRTGEALASAGGRADIGGPDETATRLLAARGIDSLWRLSAHSGGGRPANAVEIGDRAVAPPYLDTLSEESVALVTAEHETRPLRSGLPIATLAERLGVEPDVAEVAVERSELLERRGPDVARPGHQARLTPGQQASWERARALLASSLAVPDQSDLGLDPEILHFKIRVGELVRISPNLVYLPEQIEEIKSGMAQLGEGFTVADFRDVVNLSRKYAVPILEWSDREGLTVRRGDLRRLR